jgi:hypothetical protein
MITIRIDVSKIDKNRLFKGDKGTYLDCVLIETPNAKYGNDYMVVESITKEESQAGHKGTILGNGKTIGKKQAEPPATDMDYSQDSMKNSAGTYSREDDTPTDPDGLPFVITIFLAVGTLLPMLF